MTAPSPSAPSAKCPICGRPREALYRPFCSRRCANLDLQRWLTGRYRIDQDDPDADEDAE